MKTLIILFLFVAVVGCNSKQPAVNNTYITNPITGGGGGTCTGTNCPAPCTGSNCTTPTPISGCDGIARANATSCYYKNIPRVQVSGGVYGQSFWKSNNLPGGISQNQFVTDASFNVRIIARSPTSGNSTFGRSCSPYMLNSKKLRVKIQLQKAGVSPGEEATLTSEIDVPSKVWRFSPPKGTTQPYVLEVVNVESDARCSGAYGTPLASCPSNPYSGIPVNTSTQYQTECAAFDIQFSTDETYDLPGALAN